MCFGSYLFTVDTNVAGPVFKEHVKEGNTRPFIGSMMVVNAPSREIVREILEQDIFVTEGIWDWEHVQILPFETMLRRPAHSGSEQVPSQ